jgi:hypothetical protein
MKSKDNWLQCQVNYHRCEKLRLSAAIVGQSNLARGLEACEKYWLEAMQQAEQRQQQVA